MSILNDIEFANPWLLLLLLLIPLYWAWLYYSRKKNKVQAIVMPGLSSTTSSFYSWRSRSIKVLPFLKYLGLVMLLVALAKPRTMFKEEIVKGEGIDIMLVMDVSGSMSNRDFQPNRLEVAKEMAIAFVDKRSYDRIGLVVFSGESYTKSPLTTDYLLLKDMIRGIEFSRKQDGTAIGMGLATAINRLKDSESVTKIAVLLTDGVNNVGYIKPITAAQIAKTMKVKTYTIGMGKVATGRNMFGREEVYLDEKELKEISRLTDGKYYRARSSEELVQIYAEIDKLEKSEIETTIYKRYSEKFRFFLLLGMVLILLWFVLRNTIYRVLN